MKNWEDIFKESLRDCSSSLPEGSLEEFQSRLSSSRKAPVRRLAWLAVPAAAACMALALLLPRHASEDLSQSGVTLAQAPSAAAEEPAVDAAAAEDAPEPVEVSIGHEAAVRPVATAHTRRLLAQAVEAEVQNEPVAAQEETVAFGVAEEKDSNNQTESAPQKEEVVSSPTVPESAGVTRVALEKDPGRSRHTSSGTVLRAGGSVLGGSLVAVAASVLGAEVGALESLPAADMACREDASYTGTPVNSVIRRHHDMPLKIGVTARYPLSERLYLMTGLEYSLYHSETERFLTGKEQQYAHYVGIPVRLDWNAIRTRRVDFYLGAGASADLCVSARSGGVAVDGSGLNLSLLGAGGALLKLSSHVGLYLEPQVSLNPMASESLETYRTEHPIMFGVSTGIRFTLNHK